MEPVIRNLTPHPVVLYDHTKVDMRRLVCLGRAANEEAIAEAELARWSAAEEPARMHDEQRSPVSYVGCIPVRTVDFGQITGLPAPEDGVHYIVSKSVVMAAMRAGRTTSDLLTCAGLIRSSRGTVIGVTSFYRW